MKTNKEICNCGDCEAALRVAQAMICELIKKSDPCPIFVTCVGEAMNTICGSIFTSSVSAKEGLNGGVQAALALHEAVVAVRKHFLSSPLAFIDPTTEAFVERAKQHAAEEAAIDEAVAKGKR